MKILKSLIFRFLKLYLRARKDLVDGKSISILLPDGKDDWILTGIAKEIKYIYPDVRIVRDIKEIKTKRILVMHYALLRTLFLNRIPLKYVSVFFTHARADLDSNLTEFRYYFSQVSNIFIMNGGDLGLRTFSGYESKLTVAVGGYEKGMFSRIEPQGPKKVCFVSRYYDRKNPELILKIVKSNPDLEFHILGRGWEEWDDFSSLLSCRNFTYTVTDYHNYNQIYQQMSFFVSVSTKEGGPIPLLETMSCGITPISTNTGFAGDVIDDGVNGFIISRELTEDKILLKINKILESDPLDSEIVSGSVEKYDWINFSSLVVNKMLNEEP